MRSIDFRAQPAASADAAADLSPLRIPHRTHRLDNGLRVVVSEERSCPLVAVHLMIHTGSRNETPGRTGLAHLLEHLLFEGTEHCPKGGFDRLLEEVGGAANGSTWWDRTNYFETVPSHAVERALWLERERMLHFLPVLDDETLAIQRGVVLNERREVYDNRPYGMAEERLQHALFPEGHPYRHPTIGYAEDIAALDRNDAERFFRQWYTPSHSVLVIAGDIDPDKAVDLADRYLGDWEEGDGAPPPSAPPTAPAGSPVVDEMGDRVSFPRIYLGWRVPSYGTHDWAALDVLGYLLSDGETSRLRRRLVRDERLAQNVDAYLYPTEMEGLFGITTTARAAVDPELLERATRETIAEVARGVSEAEVAGAVRRARRDQIESIATVEDRAEALAYATTVLGEAAGLDRALEHYRRVTADDLTRVAAEYLAEGGASVRIVPEGAGR